MAHTQCSSHRWFVISFVVWLGACGGSLGADAGDLPSVESDAASLGDGGVLALDAAPRGDDAASSGHDAAPSGHDAAPSSDDAASSSDASDPSTDLAAIDGALPDLLALDAALPSGVTVADVAIGGEHTCARFTDGKIKCWGRNQYGQLGLGDTLDRGDGADEMGAALPFVDLGVGRSVVSLAAGVTHTCALLDNGKVKCWGRNLWGALGLGDAIAPGDEPGEMGDALPALDLGSVSSVVSLSAGAFHTCALFANSKVKCWGWNVSGQLGLGDKLDRGNDTDAMGDALGFVNLGAGRTALAVVAGFGSSCALLDNHRIKCWGEAWDLGIGDGVDHGSAAGQMGDNLPYVDLGTLLGDDRTAKSIAAGGVHTCALLSDNAVKCWGDNKYGQLGLGDKKARGIVAAELGDALPLVNVGTNRTVLAMDASSQSTCAILDNQRLKCWGGATVLGLGDPKTRGDDPNEMGDALPYVNLGDGRTPLWIRGGSDVMCALLDNQQLKCWGANAHGQLGLGDTKSRGTAADDMGDLLPYVDLGAM